MTSRYRTVGLRASVDESLFGERTSEMTKSKGSRKIVTGPLLAQSVVITQEELERIKTESVFKTEKELQAERDAALQAKAERERKARERKERMKHLEHLATLKAKLSDAEVEKQAKDQAVREAAASMMDQRSEVYKSLMSMSARAIAFTLREKQLEEKHRREESEREYDRSMDIVMEIDRLKDIDKREREESMKRKKRIDDRKVITEQMEQRQRVKLLAAELREQENNAMRALMKKYEEEEVAANSKRKVEIEKSRLEVVAANEDAIRRKHEAKLLEKKEIEDILIYQAQKDAELLKREEEERQLEHAKKERQALLLAQQERAQNNADKLDEIRARRAAEQRERKAREKEREIQIKKKAEMEELQRSRNAQAADKRQREEIAKLQRSEEYENALQHMAKMAMRETEEKAYRARMAEEHRTNLSKQIDENRRVKTEKFSNTQNEGTQIRQDLLRDVSRFEVIRDSMVNELEAKGVNPRFLTEMKAVDINKILGK